MGDTKEKGTDSWAARAVATGGVVGDVALVFHESMTGVFCLSFSSGSFGDNKRLGRGMQTWLDHEMRMWKVAQRECIDHMNEEHAIKVFLPTGLCFVT
jgi:hypothetical protein